MNRLQGNIKCDTGEEKLTKLVVKEELGCNNRIWVTERNFESTQKTLGGSNFIDHVISDNYNSGYKGFRFVKNECTNEFFKYNQNCSKDDQLHIEVKEEIECQENFIDAIIKDESIDIHENKVFAEHFIYKEANICDQDAENFKKCSEELSNESLDGLPKNGADVGIQAGKNLQSSTFDDCMDNLNKHIYGVNKFECDSGDLAASDDGKVPKSSGTNKSSAKHFECQTCDFATSRRYRLKDHVEAVHLKVKKYTCSSCDYRAYSKGGIKAHLISIHSERNDIKCNLCDYETNRKNYLTRHVNAVHLNLKHFECPTCNYATCRRSDLKKHVEAVHSKQRDYKARCETNVKVRENNARSGRDAVRLKTKNHRCDICDYKAYKKSTLDSHVNAVHLKLRNFKCHMCDYAATREYGLKHHLEAVHMLWKNHISN